MKIYKKGLMLIAGLVFSALTATMYADGYGSLKFTMDNGQTYVVETYNLEFTVGADHITFNNTNLTIPVNSVVSMEFTDPFTGPAEVDKIEFNTAEGVEVFTVDGMTLGAFNTCAEAIGSLSKGVYVIKDAKGNSLKIRVGQ